MFFRFIVLALAVFLAVPATAGADNSLQNKVRAEIMPSFEAMQAAADVHDADAHIAFLANDPNLIFVINGRRIIGWKTVLDQQRKHWPERIPAWSGTGIPYGRVGPDFIVLGPDSALLSFVLVYPKTDAAGRRIDRTLAISHLWRKRPEGWRVIYVHESIAEKPATD